MNPVNRREFLRGTVRAGGPGADVGNRDAVLKMHEGSVPFWQTPRVADVRGPSLEEARQADRLSR